MNELQEHPLSLASELDDRIQTLKNEIQQDSPLYKQLEMYAESVSKSRHYLEDTHHDIAFIGSIGVGKTTALCRLVGLYDEELKDLLSTSSGRTTLCEVEVRYGAQPKILVTPMDPAEVKSHLLDFVCKIESKMGSDEATNEHQSVIPAELERCLRNMLKLTVKRDKNKDDNRVISKDLAKQRLESLNDAGVFLEECLSNLHLDERTTLEHFPSLAVEPKEWLKKTFGDINQGQNPSTPIPARIVVEWPTLAIDHDEVSFSLIDTRGLDEKVEREDIDERLKSDRTLAVVCSRFNDAPERSIQSLLLHMKDIGLENALTEDTLVLVIPRDGEDAKVMAESGIVADAGEGRLVREEQIQDALRSKLRLCQESIPQVAFINRDSQEDLSQVRKTLSESIQRMRTRRILSLRQIEKGIEEIETNRDEANSAAAFRTVSNSLRAWANKSNPRLISVQGFNQPLLSEISQSPIHAATIRASVNRNGCWGGFDFYYLLSVEARKNALSSMKPATSDLEAVLENLEAQEHLSPAHPFIRQIHLLTKARVESILDEASAMAKQGIESQLRYDDAFWFKQKDQWGRGPGYKSRIADGAKGWFDQHPPAQLETEINETLSAKLNLFIGEVEGMLESP